MLVLLALLLIYDGRLYARIGMVGLFIGLFEFEFGVRVARCFGFGVMDVVGFGFIVVLIRSCLRMFFDAGRSSLGALRSI